MNTGRRLLRCCFLLLPLQLAPPQLMPAAWAGDAPGALETQVKAAYLYKFATYVDWPAAPPGEQPVTIGVAGADALAAELSRLSQQYKVHERPVAIRRLRPGEDAAGLQMLYVGQLDAAQSRRLLDSVADRPVLTVTDSPASPGVISFVAVDERVRFEVSLARAESHGLKISARLLGVAYRIDGRTP